VKGKVAYLSPEQLEQLPIDRRSDIFTLGTTLWEMTTMRRLFKRDQDLATLLAIREATFVDPSSLVAGYPEVLSEIVQRSLAKMRDERYPRASDFACDLDAFVGPEPARSMQARIGRWVDDLFQGDRERQMGWLRTTRALEPDTSKATTLTPPAPLPWVSIPTGSEAEAVQRTPLGNRGDSNE
jgi:serine/threonine protein kinase